MMGQEGVSKILKKIIPYPESRAAGVLMDAKINCMMGQEGVSKILKKIIPYPESRAAGVLMGSKTQK